MLAYAGKGKVAIGRVDMNRLVHEMTELLSLTRSSAKAEGELAATTPAPLEQASNLQPGA